jgi:uncharacterized membrane protein YgdD (TMEM256/DUF423 family)
MARMFLAIAGGLGFLGVALGAFGAHGLQGRLAALSDGAKRLEWWHTATTYLVWHALLLALIALLAREVETRPLQIGGWLVVAGCALFSGSLYAMTLTGVTKLGAITPLGGLAFLGAWACVVVHALRR